MALEDAVGCCLTLNKVLALLVVSNCANSALFPIFSTGSLEAAWSPGSVLGPLTVGDKLLLLPGCFMTIELLRVLNFGLGLAWYRGTAKFSASLGGSGKVALMGRLFERYISLVGCGGSRLCCD